MKKVLFLCFLIFSFLQANDVIDVQLSATKQNAAKGIITVSVTNKSNEDIEILTWGTPFEKEFSADIFSVKNKKGTVKYLGRHVKRSGKPSMKNKIKVKAGKTRSVKVFIYLYYDLNTGEMYEITSKADFIYYTKAGIANKVFSQKNGPTVFMYFTTVGQKNILSFLKPKKFGMCTQLQISTLNKAHKEAIVLAKDAEVSTGLATQKKRYIRWFGAKNISKKSTIATSYKSINNALRTQNIIYDCSCLSEPETNTTVYAYVYPEYPYYINICNEFWNSELLGMDSQAGTIIHEMTHFKTILNTHDHEYGVDDVKKLAKNEPGKSIENADSYEYFAEDYDGSYFIVTTTIKRKEESKKERRGNSMIAGPRSFITTNIVETKSKQLMYVDIQKGRVILLPLKEKDSSLANLQSYKFDRKVCKYDLVTDTQVDKHIRHKQASVLNHNIKLGSDDYKKSRIIFQIRDAGLKKNIIISWKELESIGYILKKDTYKKETQRFAGISFGRDYDLKQDKAATLVLNNLPLGKKDRCQVRGVHDMFTGEGASQFDLSFKYEIQIAQARTNDIEIFNASNVSDHWEYRAKEIIDVPANGILESFSNVTRMPYENVKERFTDMGDTIDELDLSDDIPIDKIKLFTDEN